MSSKQRQDSINATFSASSIDSTSIGEKLFGPTVDDGDGDDGPVVFVCGKCKLPVGDSMSWDGSEDAQNQIRLKRESDFVVESKKLKSWKIESGVLLFYIVHGECGAFRCRHIA